MALASPLFVWEFTARLDYVADRDGTVVVELADDGVPVRAPVQEGSGTLYLRLVGGGAELRATTTTPGLSLCVQSGAVGEVEPR
jgi:hypothetical protein